MAKRHQVGIEIKTTGDPKGAKTVDQALDDVEDSARKVREELDKIDGIDPAARKQIEGVADSMDRAAVSGRRLASSKDKVSKGAQNTGLAMLEFSRAVEDAQYGIRGVLNNIPSLLMFMGAGSGLAGVVSLAAVGLSTLVSKLTETEEAAKEAGRFLEVVRDQVAAYYEEAARDGTAGFRASIASTIEALGKQNQFLQKNLELIRAKRQAELRVASASQDLELANIAAGEASGSLSQEEANAARRAIEVQRLRTASDEKILAAQENLDLISQQRADAVQRATRASERLAEKEEERVRLVERLNTLQRAQAKAEDGGFQFPPGMEQELVQLQNVFLPQLEEIISGLRAAVRSAEQQQEQLAVAAATARQQAIITEETETQVAELKIQTIETKARTVAQKEAIREGNALLQEIISDGFISVEEQRKVADFMRDFTRRFGDVSNDFTAIASDLARQAQITERELVTIKENIKRLEASRGR